MMCCSVDVKPDDDGHSDNLEENEEEVVVAKTSLDKTKNDNGGRRHVATQCALPYERTLNNLPDDLILRIVKLATRSPGSKCVGCYIGDGDAAAGGFVCEYDHAYIVRVVSWVSVTLNR